MLYPFTHTENWGTAPEHVPPVAGAVPRAGPRLGLGGPAVLRYATGAPAVFHVLCGYAPPCATEEDFVQLDERAQEMVRAFKASRFEEGIGEVSPGGGLVVYRICFAYATFRSNAGIPRSSHMLCICGPGCMWGARVSS